MRIEPLGDQAWILRDLPVKPSIAAKAILNASLPHITDVVPCLETLGVYGARTLDETELLNLFEKASSSLGPFRTHVIPVCYEMGEDLRAVAESLNLGIDDVVRLHSSTQFECFAVGFCPGFAYLGPLPLELQGVPRLPTPRTRTESGSVGITGNQTAAYPLPRPGGWPIIGKTPLKIVDEADNYFPIEVGDVIKFRPITALEFDRLKEQRL